MEILHAFPLADHWVVLRPGTDKLSLLNDAAWEVLESSLQGLGPKEIGEAWARRYRLSIADTSAAASGALASLREIGMLGPVPKATSTASWKPRRARTACAPEAPSPWALRMGLYPFTLRFGDLDLRDRLGGLVAHLLPDAPASGPSFEVLRDGPDYVLNGNGLELYRDADLGALALVLAYHSTEIAQRDETQLFVMHSGAVARNGRCVALAGASGSGKSTLTTYLASHGYDYLPTTCCRSTRRPFSRRPPLLASRSRRPRGRSSRRSGRISMVLPSCKAPTNRCDCCRLPCRPDQTCGKRGTSSPRSCSSNTRRGAAQVSIASTPQPRCKH
jgi:hypothetical protein